MKNKILIPIFILGALAAFFSFRDGDSSSEADRKKQIVLETVMKTLRDDHFMPRAIDDSFSNKVYHKVLENLDFDKKFFTQQDLDILDDYQYKIDDQMNSGSVEFFNKLNEVFSKRIDKVEGYYKEILNTPFTFTGNDSIQLAGEKLNYVVTDGDLKARWTEYLKYRVLAKYVDLKKSRETNKEDKELAKKTDAELEKEARESVRKNQETYFKRWRKIKDEDRFAIFINSITTTEDPHTNYLPPVDKQRFDEAMSGSFVGIGAQLKEEEGKIKIAAILPGTPAKKQGELKAGDEITKVAQGSEEPVDVEGFDLDEVVKKIRGKKGTEVRLTIKSVDGATKIVPIIRGEVLMEETFAKSAIIQGKEGPVGYIYLPEFYANFNDRSSAGRRSFIDVALEVEKLNKEGVKGIILDLRNNGGGSLDDVVQMGGLFVDKGPMVQVKNSGVKAMQLDDERAGTLYDGPLVIMVNQNSASASEILAAAMQDYKRAVVVGTTTFGKGTVQRLVSLDDRFNRNNPLSLVTGNEAHTDAGGIGSLKLTFQKFYRINGGSTQLKGVTPDVILPDPYSEIDMGERRDEAALKWDEIPAAKYAPVPNAVSNVNALADASRKRVAANPSFKLIQEGAQKIKEREENNMYPLSEAGYRKVLDEANATSKKMEDIEKKGTQLSIVNVKEDLKTINEDSSRITKNADWLKALQKDIYLAETLNILNDLSKSQSRVTIGNGMK